MITMNDIMANAYSARIQKAEPSNMFGAKDTLATTQSFEGLDEAVLHTVASYPGETREDTWFRIVEAHFMRYLASEYKQTVLRLVNQNRLVSPTPRPTKRLNDSCKLFLP